MSALQVAHGLHPGLHPGLETFVVRGLETLVVRCTFHLLSHARKIRLLHAVQLQPYFLVFIFFLRILYLELRRQATNR